MENEKKLYSEYRVCAVFAIDTVRRNAGLCERRKLLQESPKRLKWSVSQPLEV